SRIASGSATGGFLLATQSSQHERGLRTRQLVLFWGLSMDSMNSGQAARGSRGVGRLKPLRYAVAMALGGASLYAGTAQGQLDEIVVTATYRATNVQDTPIAITAVTSKLLEDRGQTNIVDVANQAPNVTMTPAGQGSGSAMITFIRGIGQSDFNYALEPGV